MLPSGKLQKQNKPNSKTQMTQTDKIMQKIILNITGTQQFDSETDKIELTTVGTMRDDGNAYIIRYSEQPEPPSAPIKVNIRIEKNGGFVEMTRSTGKAGSCLSIEKANRNLCSYKTPYGEMLMGIYGKEIELDVNDTNGSFYFNYDIDINGAVSSTNTVKIDYSITGVN